MPLSGKDLERLREIICDLFTRDELERALAESTPSRDLGDLVVPAAFTHEVFQLIQLLEREGSLGQLAALLAELRKGRPDEVREAEEILAGVSRRSTVPETDLGAASPTPRPPNNLPARSDKFAGRKEALEELHRRLNRETAIGITRQTAIHAAGGVGKTALAIEYAWAHLNDYPGGLLFVSCEATYPLTEIAALARPLGIPEAETPEEGAARVKARLETGEPALLILDNLTEESAWIGTEASACLPSGSCRRLLTTRSARLPGLNMYRLTRLGVEDGVKLLAHHRDDAKEKPNREAVRAIVEWFDGLAVGLTVVGVYMFLHEELGWPDYQRSLQSRGLETVRSTEATVGRLPDYERRVDSVLDELLEVLPAESRRTLEYAALLPPDQIVRSWLEWLLDEDGELELPLQPGFEDRPAEPILTELVNRQLLRPLGEEGGLLGLHRVLREALGERLVANKTKREGLLDRVVALAESRGPASHDALTDQVLRRELTPLLSLSRELEGRGRLAAAALLTSWLSTPLGDLGRFQEGVDSLSWLDKPEALSVVSEEQTATGLSNLAIVLQGLGEFAPARERLERAIEIDQRHLDSDDPLLATSYSNLAMVLKNLGELTPAQERMERAIEIQQKHFDPDHPKLATSLNNLATILQAMGEFGPAREQIKRVIEIELKHFDPDHPTLATSYNNLGHIELEARDKQAACGHWRRALEILQRNFPDSHPHVRSVLRALEKHCG